MKHQRLPRDTHKASKPTSHWALWTGAQASNNPSPNLSDQEKAVLRTFAEQARFLESHTLIQGRQLRARWSLSWTKGKGSEEATHRVDYEALESLLVRLRPFTLNDEEVYLPKIVNKLKPHFAPNIDHLKSITDKFFNKKEYSGAKIIVNGQEFTEETLFNDFVNSRVFHRDAERKKRLDALGDLLEDGFAYTAFLSAVVTKVNAVRALKGFIEIEAGI